MNIPLAYEWAGLTFCPSCAHTATALGFLVAGYPPPKNMDEAIASGMLIQIEKGMKVTMPVATMNPTPDRCENCNAVFIEPIPGIQEEEVA